LASMICVLRLTCAGLQACRSVPGFIHLALGDPLQKRHYYRAGWMKFQDDADMQKAVVQVGEKKVRRHSGVP
jgi:hypothetical protein